jgi:hypothetical protein
MQASKQENLIEKESEKNIVRWNIITIHWKEVGLVKEEKSFRLIFLKI